MSEYKKGLSYHIQKELSLVITITAAALMVGIIMGFLDGLFDIVSNKLIFDHPKYGQALSFLQKTSYLTYSMTLSGIFYGVLGLIFGFILFIYCALWRRKLDTPRLALLSFWFLFLFIILKTGVLVFSKPVSVSLGYKVFFLAVAILLLSLFSLYLYRLSYRRNLSDSSKETDFISLGFRLIIVSILFSGIVSLLLKVFGESGLLVRIAILSISMILTLISYQLVKKVFTDDRLGRWQHNFSIEKTAAFLIAFLMIAGCLGVYQETRQKNPSYDSNAYLSQKSKNKTNVILILIDTLRADHMSSYGYERQTSPNIDRMAKEGVLFWNAISPASWTKPSTASLLTSLYPSMHGVMGGADILPQEVTTLAEVLKKAGYLTAGFVANPQVKAIFNFNKGFDFYDDSIVEDKIYYVLLRSSDLEKKIIRNLFKLEWSWTDDNNAEMISRKIIPWLKENKDTDFFLYLHYIDPHEPYSPPSPFDTKYTDSKMDGNGRNIALYDGEIAYTDKYIGALLQTLKELNIADRTLVVLTADHGEEFYEHGGTGHGQSLYQELIHVPLIMRYPSFLPAGRIIKDRMEITDIMPSILEILNVPWNGHMEGISLLPLIRGKSIGDNEDYLFSETYLGRFRGRAITYKKWKYIFTESSELRDITKLGSEELYDLENDPNELNNLIAHMPDVAKKFREKSLFFTRYMKEKAISSPKASIDEKTREQLKALGYVDN